MKKNYLYLAALAMFTAACSNEDEFAQEGIKPSPEVKMITETIKASNGDNKAATRAAVDVEAQFSWSEGDQIAVHVSDGKYYTTDALAAGAGGSDEAKFTVSYPEDYSRDAFAVFPASIVATDATNYGQESAALDVTLPASYTLAQVSGTTTPCPMIATNTGASWVFSQLCGMLRLTVNGIPGSARYLKIDFNGKKVQGDFAIAIPVTPDVSTIATSATTGTDDIITITGLNLTDWTDGMVLNLPLPTGDYTDVTVTAYDSSNKAAHGVTCALKASGPYTATRAHGRKATASMLRNFISVSKDKKVVFAPGNLQYLGNADGTGTWRFAEHQYDFIGDGPSNESGFHGNVTVAGYTKYNNSADKDAARDLFGWGTSGCNGYNPWTTSESNGSYVNVSLIETNSDYDWGVYHSASGNSSEKIINGGDYSWRLFTSTEWAYAINRTSKVALNSVNNENLFAAATVVGVKGIILFPDNWTGSSDIDITYGNESGDGYPKTVCDAETWAKFEKQGCVFLPAAHVRLGTALQNQNEGKYWSSTVFMPFNNDWRGGSLDFDNTGTVFTSSNNKTVRRYGLSVRLIREVE